MAAWIWKGESGERRPGNISEQFPEDTVKKIGIFWEGWLPESGRGNLGRGAQAAKVIRVLKKLLTK